MSTVFPIPNDINGDKEILSPAVIASDIRVGIYSGYGAQEQGIENVEKVLAPYEHIHTARVSAQDIVKGFIDSEVLVFSGGASHKEASGIGDAGEEAVRSYVRERGSYLGICAGAHLAVTGYEWGLKIINAKKVIDGEWKRGQAFVDIALTPEGKEIFGEVEGTFKCRYHNGIIFKPAEDEALSPYTPLAYFRSEVSENGTTAGAMLDTPAIVCAEYGKGKVLLISPHPENTPGLEHLVSRAVAWLAKS